MTPEVPFAFLPDLNIGWFFPSYFVLTSNLGKIRLLEKENANLKRALGEKEKETTARDQYEKALFDRLSIVAEGLSGNNFNFARRAV